MKKNIVFWGTYNAEMQRQLHMRLDERFDCVHLPADQYDPELLKTADCILLRGPKMPAQVLDECAGKLRLIQRWGAGYDGIDSKHSTELGIYVSIAAGVNANAVAELTLALLLALYRNIVPLHQSTVNGGWSGTQWLDRSFEIQGKTAGLVGCGNIGRQVAKKLTALGAKVIYYDPYRLKPEMEAEYALEYVSMDELLERADIISLHLPALDSTKGMVNKDFLNKMKPTAVLLNAARGSLVNEADLNEALRSGRIMGAALDSLAEEPPAADNPLFTCPNILITPHVGGTSADLSSSMAARVAANIISFFDGEPMHPGDLVEGPGL